MSRNTPVRAVGNFNFRRTVRKLTWFRGEMQKDIDGEMSHVLRLSKYIDNAGTCRRISANTKYRFSVTSSNEVVWIS